MPLWHFSESLRYQGQGKRRSIEKFVGCYFYSTLRFFMPLV
jgi:hypothetical protein